MSLSRLPFPLWLSRLPFPLLIVGLALLLACAARSSSSSGCHSRARIRTSCVRRGNVVTTDSRELGRHFFAAVVTLACHTGSLQERLADAYADHLLQVVASDLPAELQPVFRE